MRLVAFVCFGTMSMEHPVRSWVEARQIVQELEEDGICGAVLDVGPQNLGVVASTRKPCAYVLETGECWLDDHTAGVRSSATTVVSRSPENN